VATQKAKVPAFVLTLGMKIRLQLADSRCLGFLAGVNIGWKVLIDSSAPRLYVNKENCVPSFLTKSRCHYFIYGQANNRLNMRYIN